MNKYRPDYKNAFRILKGGKISLVVSAMLLSSVATVSEAAVNIGDTYINVVSEDASYILGGENDTFTGDDSYISIPVIEDGSYTGLDALSIDTNDYSFEFTIDETSEVSVSNITDNSAAVYSDSSSYITGVDIWDSMDANATFTNNGEININSTTTVTDYEDATLSEGSYYSQDDVTGLYGEDNGGAIINNGNIDVNSQAIAYDYDNEATSGEIDSSAYAYSYATGIEIGYNDGLVLNTGDIYVSADANTNDTYASAYADGIFIHSNSTDSNVTNTGTITVRADGDDYASASGIVINGDHYGVVDNAGSIDVAANDYADGIEINGANFGEITSADMTVTAFSDATGISVDYNGEDASISNTGTMTVTSNDGYADGIEVNWANFGEITSADMTVTAFSDATGISVDYNGEDGSISNTGTMTVTSNDGFAAGIEINSANFGEITSADMNVTAFNDAVGISTFFNGEDGSISNTGTMTVTSNDGFAAGIGVYGNFGDIINESGATINVDAGEDGFGIYVGEDNFGLIANNGTINVTADNDAAGIYVGEDNFGLISSDTMTVTSNDGYADGIEVNGANFGEITSKDMNVTAYYDATGISVDYNGEDASISNTGTMNIVSNNGDAYGIVEDFSGMMFANNGDIINESGATINVDAGEDGFGIFVGGDNNGLIANNGTINVDAGEDAVGISVDDDNFGLIANNGTINVDAGEDAFGIAVWDDNDGNITSNEMHVTAYNDATGIYIDDDNYGFISSDTMTVTTIDDDADGIEIGWTNFGEITSHDMNITAYDDATGIYVGEDNVGLISSDTMTVTSNDDDAFGIIVWGDNDGNITSNEMHVTAYDEADGIYVGEDNVGLISSDTMTVTANDDANGIHVGEDNFGSISSNTMTVTSNDGYADGIEIGWANFGEITSTDMNVTGYYDALGISAEYNGEDASISNTGTMNIVSTDEDAYGISVWGDNDGNITSNEMHVTAYDDADGIYVGDDNYGLIANNGTINVNAGEDAHGIVVDDDNYGNITSNEMHVTADYDDADGILVDDDNHGLISSNIMTVTAYDDADGIDLGDDNYGLISSDTMTVTSYDNDADGIEIGWANFGEITSKDMNVTAYDDALGIKTVYNGEDASISNTGTMNIVSNDGDAYGIVVWGDNDGNITSNEMHVTAYDDADGIYVGEDNFGSISSDTMTVAANDYADGIYVGEDNFGLIANNGTMTVTSNYEATGIYVGDDNYGNINNNGDINVTAGVYATGIYVDYNDDGIIENSGAINVDAGEDAAGIYVWESYGDGSAIINNEGATITATIDGELDYNAYSVIVDWADDYNEINNAGTLSGNIYADSVLTNNGTIILPWNANHDNDAAFVSYLDNTETGTITVALNTTDNGEVYGRYSQIVTDTTRLADGSTIYVDAMTALENQPMLEGTRLDDVIVTDGSLSITGNGEFVNVMDNSDILTFAIAADEAGLGQDSIDLNVGVEAIDGVDSHLAMSVAAQQMIDVIHNVVEERQRQVGEEGLNSGGALTAAQAGVPVPVPAVQDNNFWMKPFYAYGNQSAKDGFNGFDLHSYGLGAGIDGAIGSDSRIGLALFYTNADIDMKDATAQADAENYTAMVYGSTSLTEDNTVKFLYQLGYSKQNNDYKRTITSVESISGTADIFADYTSNVVSLDLGIMGQKQISESLLALPIIEARLRRFETPDFTEVSTETSATYDISNSVINQSILSAGSMFESTLSEDSKFVTDLRVGYNFSHDDGAILAKYAVDARPAYTDIGLIDNGGFVYNVGFKYETESDDMIFDLSYDLEGQGADYQNHMFSAKAVFKF